MEIYFRRDDSSFTDVGENSESSTRVLLCAMSVSTHVELVVGGSSVCVVLSPYGKLFSKNALKGSAALWFCQNQAKFEIRSVGNWGVENWRVES